MWRLASIWRLCEGGRAPAGCTSGGLGLEGTENLNFVCIARPGPAWFLEFSGHGLTWAFHSKGKSSRTISIHNAFIITTMPIHPAGAALSHHSPSRSRLIFEHQKRKPITIPVIRKSNRTPLRPAVKKRPKRIRSYMRGSSGYPRQHEAVKVEDP